jgi:hypothetical protein
VQYQVGGGSDISRPLPTNPGTPTGGDSLSGGAIAGIAVGCVGGAALLSGVAYSATRGAKKDDSLYKEIANDV